MKISEKELKILNSKRGLKHLLQGDEKLDYNKTINYVSKEIRIKELQEDLIKIQNWVIENGKRVIIIFEGRDAAGKGGAIRRFTHYLNPRQINKIALPKPTEDEESQWYFQRYINKLPKKGEIVFFDRSWYNRAVVEPVNGFCTKKQYNQFMNQINAFESMLIEDDLILFKYYFSISKKEQAKRFEKIKTDPLKKWKISPVDDRAQELWEDYTDYKNKMFEHTNTKNAPWTIFKGNVKIDARIESMEHFIENIQKLM